MELTLNCVNKIKKKIALCAKFVVGNNYFA